MGRFDGRSYQSRIDDLAASGIDVHGEAELVRRYHPRSVLDAGCGTGRVAIELSRHDVTTLGADVDASMIAEARRRAPDLEWLEADVAALDLADRFDVVVMAGNVPLFCPPASRPALVGACARHLHPGGGRLIAGFSLDRDYRLDDYDRCCAEAGLVLEDRWSTWDRRPFGPGADYAVTVHRTR